MMFSISNILSISSLVLGALAIPSLSPRDDCYDYVLVATRGTTELQGPSIAFQNMTATTLSRIPNGLLYNTVYPASWASGSLDAGADAITQYINDGLQNCPQQKYALLGYSQGATATALALRNFADPSCAGYNAIAGVLLVGNPLFKPYQAVNRDQNGTKATDHFTGVLYRAGGGVVPLSWYQSAKLIDICYYDDFVCNGATKTAMQAGWRYHLSYGITPSVQDMGATFLYANILAAL